MGADAGYWEDNWAWVHLIVPAGSQPMAYSANAGTKIFLACGWKKKRGGGQLAKMLFTSTFQPRFKRSLAKWSDKQIPPFYPPCSFNCHISLLKFREWLILRHHGASPRIASKLWNVALRVLHSQMQNVVYDLLHQNSFESNNNDEKKIPISLYV